MPAAGHRGHQHQVADRDTADLRARLDDGADCLVPQRDGFEQRVIAIPEVQVRPADGGGGDGDDRPVRIRPGPSITTVRMVLLS